MHYLNKFTKIQNEGVTYTGFFYEVVNSTVIEDEVSDFHRDRVKKGGNGSTRVLGTHHHIMDSKNANAVKWKSRIHDPYQAYDYHAFRMGVTGTIEYKNTHGFLSADQHPLIMINYISFIVYCVFLMYWISQLARWYHVLIQLHWMVLIVLISAFFQTLMSIVYYSWRNNQSDFTGRKLFLSIATLELFRNTFSRVLTLMVALGFQIVIKNVHKYANKITVLCVVLMVSMVLSFMV